MESMINEYKAIGLGMPATTRQPSLYHLFKGLSKEHQTKENLVKLTNWFNSGGIVPPDLSNDKAKNLTWHGKIAFPKKYFVENGLRLEQAALLMKRYPGLYEDPELIDGMRDEVALALLPILILNATSILHGQSIPSRFYTANVNVLKLLVDMVITQRNRKVFESDTSIDAIRTNPADHPEAHLALVMTIMNNAAMTNVYPDPYDVEAEAIGLTADFFLQCAIAYSVATKSAIPAAYETTRTGIYAWAYRMLHAYQTSTEQDVEEAKRAQRPRFSVVK